LVPGFDGRRSIPDNGAKFERCYGAHLHIGRPAIRLLRDHRSERLAQQLKNSLALAFDAAEALSAVREDSAGGAAIVA
jgi:hypothetical protein